MVLQTRSTQHLAHIACTSLLIRLRISKQLSCRVSGATEDLERPHAQSTQTGHQISSLWTRDRLAEQSNQLVFAQSAQPDQCFAERRGRRGGRRTVGEAYVLRESFPRGED